MAGWCLAQTIWLPSFRFEPPNGAWLPAVGFARRSRYRLDLAGEFIRSADLGSRLANSLEEVPGDLPGARVRAFGRGIDGRSNVTGRLRKAVAPPAGGGIEDEIAARAGINCGGVSTAVELAGFRLRRAGGHDFQARNPGRIAVPLPADQAGDAVALFHPGLREKPMVGPGANPIRAAGERCQVARADQRVRVGALMREPRHGGEGFEIGGVRRPIRIDAAEEAMRDAERTGARIDSPAAGVAGKEGNVKP